MHTQSGNTQVSFFSRFRGQAIQRWDNLTEKQKALFIKSWSIITYKWRWQIAMNVPYLAVFLLDRTIPAVHEFDMGLLTTVTSKLPIPAFISSLMGLG